MKECYNKCGSLGFMCSCLPDELRFGVDKSTKDGLNIYCVQCKRKYDRDKRRFYVSTPEGRAKEREKERRRFISPEKRSQKNEYARNRARIRYDTPEGKKEILASNNRYYNTPKGRYAVHLVDCRKMNRINEFTFEDFLKIEKHPCYYCGQFSDGKNYCGIDRVNNSLDYLLTNSVPCCDICNFMKSDMSKDKFIEHCIKLTQFQKSKT